MGSRRWQHALLPFAGAWMLCSPFLLPSYGAAEPIAVWASHAAGAMLLVSGSVSLVRPTPWLDWAGLIMAAWLIVAPLVLGFATIADKATSNHMLVGMFVGLVTLLSIALQREQPRDTSEQP